AVPGRRAGEDPARQRDGLGPPDAPPVPHPRSRPVPSAEPRPGRRAEPGLEGHGPRADRRDGRHPLGRHESRHLDGALPHRRAPRGRNDVQLPGRRSLMCEHMFVGGEATILHADLDSFYASVEQRDDPRLRGRPVIVGGGVVLAASYEAKAYGVRTPMGSGQWRRLCPDAVVVSPRMSAYSEASKAVFAVFEDTTPLVEGLSIDEAFLDVGGLRRVSGTPVEIAARLRDNVRERVGLPITVGVARTKFLAKVASGVAKPDGLLVVRPDRELEFLHPLPVERLWGVGPVTAAKLRTYGIETVGEVAQLAEPVLVAMLGRASGRHLHALAHNRDPRVVRRRARRRSMGAQRALGRTPRSWEELDASLVGLVDRLARRLRVAG